MQNQDILAKLRELVNHPDFYKYPRTSIDMVDSLVMQYRSWEYISSASVVLPN